jgi:hypothetical protein
MEIDRELIAAARHLITGANVHYVQTWIFCYEVSRVDSPRHARYENLLRDFVNSNTLLKAVRRSLASQRQRVDMLRVRSAAIDRRIEKLLTSHSD